MEEITSLKDDNIWNHFKRTRDNERENLGKCNYCSKLFNATHLTNLKKHLLHKHSDLDISATNDISAETSDDNDRNNDDSDGQEDKKIEASEFSEGCPVKRKSYAKNKVWNYFEVKNWVNKTGKCKICFGIISYRSTTGNLRTHLLRRHGIDVKSLSFQQTLPTENVDIDYKYDDDSADAAVLKEDDVVANPLEEVQDSAEVRQFFQETSSKSVFKCILCSKAVYNSDKKLKRHLSDDHPDLVVIDESNDGFEEAESPLFKEFLKIKSSTKKRKSTPTPKQKQKFKPTPAKVIKMNETKQEMGEIDCFMQYIGVLLKDLSRENFSEVQLEIIKVIMAKKMQCQHNAAAIDESSGVGDKTAELLHPSSSTNQSQQ